MTKQNSTMRLIFVLPLLSLAAVSCVLTGPRFDIGELQTEAQTVEYSGTSAVSADIEMGLGDLSISGGAQDLLEAEFRYNVAEMKPDVDLNGERLRVRTPQVDVGFDSFWDMDDFQNEWDLAFSDEIAIDLEIDLGAGNAQLDLGSLQVNELHLDAGAGDVEVDLTNSGTLSELSIDAGVGQITLDLHGDWPQGLDADIQAGVGEVTIWLPSTVGVRVDVEGGLTDIDTSGMDRSGRSYFNDAWGESESEITIQINAGIGEINLIVVE